MYFRELRVTASFYALARLCGRCVKRNAINVSAEANDWYETYDTLAPARFITWLANEVANDIASQRSNFVDLEALLLAIDGNATGAMQSDAELFLQAEVGASYFHDNDRILLVFRRLLNHKLRWSKYLI